MSDPNPIALRRARRRGLVQIAKGYFVDPSEVAAVVDTPLIDSVTKKESVGHVTIVLVSGHELLLVNITAEDIVKSFS